VRASLVSARVGPQSLNVVIMAAKLVPRNGTFRQS